MLRALQTLGWFACVVYSTIPCFWFLIHPRAEYWRSRDRSPYRVLLPAWVVMWIAVAGITSSWRHVTLYRHPFSWIPAALLFAAGMWLYVQSGKNFSGKQLGGVPEVMRGQRSQKLITTGIRQRVRHPVYLAHLCELLAWSIGTGLLVCYGLTAFAIVTGAVMIRMEDTELEERFGPEYARYRETVPAVWPKMRTRE